MQKEFVSQTGLVQTSVIYNTHEVEEIKKQSLLPLNNEFVDGIVNLVAVGSFYHVKGYERLLESLYKLKNEKYRFHLSIVGDGELSLNLHQLVQRYHMQENVTFYGYQKNPYKYMAKADMLVCASYSEGFSGTVSEATILGIPTLTTDCSGMKEILGENNEYGIVVENSDDGLYKGLKMVLSNPEILASYKEKVKERSTFFSTEETVRQAEELFDKLAKE